MSASIHLIIKANVCWKNSQQSENTFLSHHTFLFKLLQATALTKILSSNAFGQIKQTQHTENIEFISISHINGEATISLYGGQVLGWQPKGHQPVFWLSHNTEYKEGKAIRGGIPLCWPWFGAYENPPIQSEKPCLINHGFARLSHWKLIEHQIHKESVSVTLINEGENKSPLWPTAYKLTQVLTFGKDFTQSLTIDNLSNQAIKYTGALHSYFCVQSPENTTIDALSDLTFHDKTIQQENQKSPLINCKGEIDRVYLGSPKAVIKDLIGNREIEVSTQGCNQWVLWNPGAKLAKNMKDIHLGGENEFVCLEAANTQWQKIKPFANHLISQKIVVRELNS